MTRLVLVQDTKKPVRRPTLSEGETAKRLLEEHGYQPRRQTVQNGEWDFPCPFHEEPGTLPRGKPTNFYLSAKTSQYYCQAASCGESGNLQTLQHYFGVENDPTLSARFQTKDVKLQQFQAHLTADRRRYLIEVKGLTEEAMDRFRLGFDPTQDCYVIPYLENRRPVAFRFYDPVVRDHDSNGKPLYGGPNGSKYWWEKAEESILGSDDNVLRLFNPAAANGDAENGRVFVCEGETKAMLLASRGYSAVSIPGVNGFKQEWARFFMNAREVVILMDNDNPAFHKHSPCHRCGTVDEDECTGHNPGQDGAVKLVDFFGYRARNVVLPLPDDDTPKTDINEYLIRDHHSFSDFDRLVFGRSAVSPFLVRTLADIRQDPPPEASFLVGQGLLPKGGRLLVAGAPKVGKAQPLDSKLLTPSGWVPMGDIKPGDEVIGSAGEPVTVTHVWPQGQIPIYRLTASDGSYVRVSGNHLWRVFDRDTRTDVVISTSEMAARLEQGRNMYLPMLSSPVQFDYCAHLPIDPYALGALIGDGSFRMISPSFASGDEEMFKLLAQALSDFDLHVYREGACYIADQQASHKRPNRLTTELQALGIWGHRSETKFVPNIYKRASANDRLALLQGLMDTDGGMEKMRSTFCTTSKQLAEDVREIVESLGGTAKTRQRSTKCRDAYVVNVRLPKSMCPFRLSRKAMAWEQTRPVKDMHVRRRIISVEPDGIDEAQCVTVDSEDSLYVTEHCLVTHNSIFIENLALSIAAGIPFLRRFEMANDGLTPGHRVLMLDRELSERSLYDRLNALIDERPGYAAAEDKLMIDHRFRLQLDAPNAVNNLKSLVLENNAEVVVFDTAYKFLGGDMESAKSVAKAFAVIDEVIAETGVSVILTHHHRKGAQGTYQEAPNPDQVMGSFLWTGWPNGTVLLNFKNRSVADPYTTIASFVAFRDAAAPEPLLLQRDKTSISYSNIVRFSFEDNVVEEHGSHRVRPKLNYDTLADLMLRAVPVLEDEFMHVAAAHFATKPENVKLYLLDILDRHPDFIRDGNGSRNSPYTWRYRHDKVEETYEEEQRLLEALA